MWYNTCLYFINPSCISSNKKLINEGQCCTTLKALLHDVILHATYLTMLDSKTCYLNEKSAECDFVDALLILC